MEQQSDNMGSKNENVGNILKGKGKYRKGLIRGMNNGSSESDLAS